MTTEGYEAVRDSRPGDMLVMRLQNPSLVPQKTLPYLCIDPVPPPPGVSNLMCDLPFGAVAMVVHRPPDWDEEGHDMRGWAMVLCNARLGWLSHNCVQRRVEK